MSDLTVEVVYAPTQVRLPAPAAARLLAWLDRFAASDWPDDIRDDLTEPRELLAAQLPARLVDDARTAINEIGATR